MIETDKVKKLQEALPIVNCTRFKPKLFLKKSITCDPKELAEALTRGLNPNATDSKGYPLLHQAVIHNHVESVKCLLTAGAEVTAIDRHGFTYLQLARFLERKELIPLDHPLQLEVRGPGKLVICTQKFFKELMGFEYIPHLVFKNIRFFRRVVKQVSKYRIDNSVAVERKWLGALYKPSIEEEYIPKIRIQYIDKQMGYGLFASQSFNPGDYIGEYTGEVKRSLFFRSWANEYVGEYALGGRDPVRFVIDARHKGNYTRFINHSDEPNASAITVLSGGLLHVIFRAEKAIAADEEITFDYGPDFWKRRKKKKR